MKKKFLTLLSFALLSGVFAFSSVNSMEKANADDHKHIFNNGACECGARVLECEDGDIQGKMTSDDPNDKWVNDFSDSDNPDHPKSGRGFVEYMQASGNTITWKFNLNKQLENVKCRLWVSTGIDNKSTNAIAFKCNGQTATWSTQTVSQHGSNVWYYFEAAVFYSNFAKGNNTFVLEMQSALSFNFDSVEIEFPKDVIYSDYVTGEPDGEMPSNRPSGGEDDPIGGGEEYEELAPISSKGSIVMEAEYCDAVIGTLGNGSSFFEDNDNASGGGVVANFGYVGDNIVKFTFEADKAVNSALISVYLAGPYMGRAWEDIVICRINGGSGGATPFSKYAGVNGIDTSSCGINERTNDYDTYVSFTCPAVSLEKGKNVFELECWQGTWINIDCVEIATNEDATFTYTPKSRGVGGKGGPASLEAEDCEVRGTVSGEEGAQFIVEAASTNDRETSGGKAIGNFATAGNYIMFYFKSNLSVEEATLSIFVAPLGNGGAIKDIVNFKLNDEEKDFEQTEFPAKAGDNKVDWTALTVKVSLKAGLNRAIFTNVKGEDFLVDNLYIDVPQNVNISVKNLDSEAPTVTPIYFTTIGIRTGKEIEFTFDYSDDFCAKEDLEVAIKVYYAFGTNKQKKVESVDNKFTPKLLGEYTVSVTVTDKAQHSTTRKRILKVKLGEDIIDEGTVVHYVDKKKVGGWVVFGVGMVAALGMVGYMVIKSKKRA